MRVPGVRRRPDSGCLPSPSSRSDSSCTKRRFPEDDEGPAVKLHMSEEAVSARLQLLSLENDHSYGGNGLPKISPRQPDTRPPDVGSDDDHVLVDPGEFSMSGCHVICPILEETVPEPGPQTIVPESLLHSLSSPCLDLVLWSPPSGPIHQLLRSLSAGEEGSRERTGRKSRREAEEGMELSVLGSPLWTGMEL